MVNRINPPHKRITPRVTYWASFVLACLGFLDSTYLVIYKLTNNNAMCLGSGGCHDVNFSVYSEIRGVPISVFGILAFLGIAGILLLEPHWKPAKDYGPLAIFGISLGGVAFTAFGTWLELYVIHAICPFCVAAAGLIALIFILAVIRLVKQTSN